MYIVVPADGIEGISTQKSAVVEAVYDSLQWSINVMPSEEVKRISEKSLFIWLVTKLTVTFT